MRGTKVSAHYPMTLESGETRVVELRLSKNPHDPPFGAAFDEAFTTRIDEADAFYEEINPFHSDVEARRVQRQAFAGLLWTKQFYHYNVPRWLNGDPLQPPPPPAAPSWAQRGLDQLRFGRSDVDARQVGISLVRLLGSRLPLLVCAARPHVRKKSAVLLAREWFMHRNGQFPAYEWTFSDVNPPVHAWAALRIYDIEHREHGGGDIAFLERIFHKLLLNFTWWVNRKDGQGNNVFQGGFLGLDNIGVFDAASRCRPADTRPIRRHELDGCVYAQHAGDCDRARDAQ